MSLRSLSMCTFTLIAVALLAAWCQTRRCGALAAAQKRQITVWSGGDDGLTKRLKASIEKEFESSSFTFK